MATRLRRHTSRGGAGIGRKLRGKLTGRGGLRVYACSPLSMNSKACPDCSVIIFFSRPSYNVYTYISSCNESHIELQDYRISERNVINLHSVRLYGMQ